MRHFIYASYLCFKSTYGFLKAEEYVLERLVNSLFQLCFFVMLASYTKSYKAVSIAVIGNAIIVCSQSCIGDLGMTFTRERYFGTLKILLVSGKSMMRLFLEKSFFLLMDSLISLFVMLVIAYFIFPSDISIFRVEAFLAIIVSVTSCMALGCLLGSLGIINPDINFVYNMLIMGLLFLSGANIVVEKLPLVFQVLSSLLPLSHGLAAIALLQGSYDIHVFLLYVLQEAFVAISYFVIAYYLFRYFEKRAMLKANIDLY